MVGTDGRVAVDYDLATPMMLMHYFPAGILGLGLCALMASFMSGMAGNTTAFNTVWTYDIYQSYINKHASDAHYLRMGTGGHCLRHSHIRRGGLRGAAVQQHHGPAAARLRVRQRAAVRDVHARHVLEARDRARRVLGLVSGTLAAAVHHGLTLPAGAAVGFKGGFLGTVLHHYPSEMAQNFWTAIFAWTTCFVVTILVSIVTAPRAEADLKGLVYSLTPRPRDEGVPLYRQPGPLALVVLLATIVLNIIFW